MSKRPPIKKIYLSIIIIAVIGYLWLNQGLSNEVLEEAFKDTIQTLKINNVTIGEIYLPQRGGLWAGGAYLADIYRDGIERYNKIGINVTLCNPSDYCLEIELDRFNVFWMSSKGYIFKLGGIRIQNDAISAPVHIILESGESKTFEMEGLALEGLCTIYLGSKTEIPEFLFDTFLDVTTSVSNGKHVQYSRHLNLDGTINREFISYVE